MGEVPKDATPDAAGRLTRDLARVVEPFHAVTYYSAEINGFRDDGFKGWWHAYFAYRPAPMGPVDVPVVAATFYNFHPRMIERAVPGVWDIMAPADAVTRRAELVAASMARIFADGRHEAVLARAAGLARRAMSELRTGARPLFAAYAALDWPDPADPALTPAARSAMVLWHACTLWREYRGDSHNIALAAAEIDGVECHVLMSASGHGNQPTIAGIRGWTEDEWRAAAGRLADRGLIDGDGAYTDRGRQFRHELERTTDRLSGEPAAILGANGGARLLADLTELVDHLKATGEVSGVWPPPTVLKPA